jgi:ribonucleotide monophosphatase NagD (HAD superfamily)
MVGDRPDTDGAFAKTLGYRFALVLSGVTRPADLPVEPTPDLTADDLPSLVKAVLARQ